MLLGARSWWRRMGSVDGWSLTTPDTEQREKAARRGSRLADAARDVHSSWGAEATGPSLVTAAAECPGEQQRGKADCRAWCTGPRPGALQAAHLRVPPVTWRSLRRASAVGQPRRTIVIWLILPVVICLSQRLSHACLSISNYTAKLRMAHYISYRLFDSTLLLG